MFGFGFWASGLSGLSGLGKKICFTQKGLYFHKNFIPFRFYMKSNLRVRVTAIKLRQNDFFFSYNAKHKSYEISSSQILREINF